MFNLKMDFLIFGDQSTETFESLHNPQLANNHVVRKFLVEVDKSLRRQISLLPRLTKDSLPDTLLSKQSFDEYAEWPTSDPILRPVLVAISQFVEVFGCVNNFSAIHRSSSTNTYLQLSGQAER